MTVTRVSMYYTPYLDATAQKRVTPATYLHGVLRGKAKQYTGKYLDSLRRALIEAEKRGEVTKVDSVAGSVAYVRTEKG